MLPTRRGSQTAGTFGGAERKTQGRQFARPCRGAASQYSSGRSTVVTERSAFVMIQKRTPSLVVNDERRRARSWTAASFASASSRHTFPQSSDTAGY